MAAPHKLSVQGLKPSDWAYPVGALVVFAAVTALGFGGRFDPTPIGFAVARESTYARVTLKAIHALARAIDSRAETLYAGAASRTVLMSLIVARPANVPGAVAASWNHATASSVGWHATLPAVTTWRPRMPAAPTTVAWGRHDRLLLTGRQAPRARRRLPEARHVILEGCGHVPTWDDPEQVARWLELSHLFEALAGSDPADPAVADVARELAAHGAALAPEGEHQPEDAGGAAWSAYLSTLDPAQQRCLQLAHAELGG